MPQKMCEIPINNLKINPFKLWDSDWLLLTCGDYKKGKYNTMTVAWGSVGNMWNIPIVMVVVRPSRYTFEFINSFDTFTLCAFKEDYRGALNILGTKSGRDGDKISETGLTIIGSEKVAAPTFQEASLSIECKKIYSQDFDPKKFFDDRIEKKYPKKDYHRMFFGEIINVKGEESKYRDFQINS